MSDLLESRTNIWLYDPNCPVKLDSYVHGFYSLQLNHGELSLTGELDVLLQIVAKAEALLEHEEIMRRKNEDHEPRKRRNDAK